MSTRARIRVLVADDQESVRFGYRTILRAAGDIDVVGEAVDGAEVLELADRLRGPDPARRTAADRPQRRL